MKARSIRSDFKYNIGDIIRDEHRNLEIIDRKRDRSTDGNIYKYYKYKCLDCGWTCGKHYNHRLNHYSKDFWVAESNLLKENGSRCACCNNKVVIKNINNLTFQYPETEKYLVNKEDGYIHTPHSNKKILCKCPNCNSKKYCVVDTLVKKGMSCNKCSDGISFPEKVIANILYQLKIDYVKQFRIKDSKRKYFYDFYFEYGDGKYIIEVNGIQHYIETKFSYSNERTLEDEILNDTTKKNLALEFGIKDENYIIIDARKSDLDYIKNNVINSKLSIILDIENINWTQCGIYASKNLLLDVCLYWEKFHNNISTAIIMEKYHLDRTTAIRYLKRGKKLGICSYDPKEEMKKQYEKLKAPEHHGKSVEIIKDGISYGIFISCRELARQSMKLFGIQMNSDKISAVCIGTQKTHKGYSFKYI